jgi:Fic family protein
VKPEEFSAHAPGSLLDIAVPRGERAWAFVPDPLPPAIKHTDELIDQLARAMLALGKLGGLGANLPNPHLLIRPFVRREALASSRIEGTRADLGQLVLFEASQDREDLTPDVQEVANYVQALEYGWSQLEYRPVSLGLIREMHAILMRGVRGERIRPGEFRTDQNYIGTPADTAATARFVPPPPSLVESQMRDLERYLSEPGGADLIRLALVHYQFEVIHPFLDGNGRLGRLLITLLLGSWGILDQPLLYISTYLEQHRDEYIARLAAVSKHDAWDAWISFFLTAVETQAEDGARRGRQLLSLREEYRREYQQGRGSGALLTVIDALFERPSVTINDAAGRTGLTFAGAQNVVQRLVQDGLLVEVTGRKRNRVFVAPTIIDAIAHQ